MRFAVTAVLAALAAAFLVALGAQTRATGFPNPLLLSATVVAVSAAVAWPLATMEPQNLCGSCHGTSLGLGDFGFCLRCGTRA